MDSRISLIILKTGASTGKEISQLCEKIKWSGRRGSPTRTLTISLLDDDGYKHARSEIDIEEGYHCIFSYDGVELFRGIFLRQSQNRKKTAEYTAYDLGVYLSNNKDTFVYENKTATDVFNDVCSRFGIPVGIAVKTNYVIPDLTKRSTTGWDTIADALSLDYDNTGMKHYVFAEKGKLYLKRRLENVLQWVLEMGTNVTEYTWVKSLENVKTRIRLYSAEGTVLAEEKDTVTEGKIGIFQDVDAPDESLTTAQMMSLAKSLLEEKKTPTRTLTLSKMPGLTDVISGVGVFVRIPHLNVNRTFYVDRDEHTFEGNLHTMTLTLNLISEIGEEIAVAESTGSYNVGDAVWFNGGKHYVSSTAQSPASTNLAAGPAQITYMNPGAVHPWHLVHTDSQTTVYGWVDDGTFS